MSLSAGRYWRVVDVTFLGFLGWEGDCQQVARLPLVFAWHFRVHEADHQDMANNGDCHICGRFVSTIVAPWDYLAWLVPMAIILPLLILPSIKRAILGFQWTKKDADPYKGNECKA